MTEIILSNKKHGMLVLLLTIVLYILAVLGTIFFADEAQIAPLVLCILYLSLGWLPLLGLKVLGPQEALVLTLFGNYIGTLKGEGFYFVNPFCTAVNPAAKTQLSQSGDVDSAKGSKVLAALGGSSVSLPKEAVTKKISLKIMTLSNARQKINDCLGNPVEIGIAVTWRVVDTGKAVFDVDNYKEFLSLQCDSALRNIVRLYPYDVSPGVDTTGDGVPDEGSLRGSSDVVAAHASEIAAAMLQRQQASAIIDARKMIVEGAVGTVEMALERLNQSGVVELDEERKAAMVSNLLVVLCGNHEAQPVVNTGSLY